MDAERTSETSHKASFEIQSILQGPIGGKYEVVGVLGEGGTGIVYDARRKSDRRPVALKVIHAGLAGDPQLRARFEREAAILRRLEGPHICPILELGELEGAAGDSLLFMALEKLDGPSLETLLAREPGIRVERAVDVAIQICAALRTAHAHGVIHRDLKPANVILERGDHAVVVDFGMSKIVAGTGAGTTVLTAHNMVFGTPEYMSPEQARGDELDARCDVYALGIILYEMLTGKPPFTGPTPLNVLTEHLTSDIEPPSKRAPEGRVTRGLEAVVMHALARDREGRYASASAMAAALMHARAAPNDVESLHPRAFATSAEGHDALARTLPAIERHEATDAPPRTNEAHDAKDAADAKDDDRTPSDTLRAAIPELRVKPPSTSGVASAPVDGAAAEDSGEIRGPDVRSARAAARNGRRAGGTSAIPPASLESAGRSIPSTDASARHTSGPHTTGGANAHVANAAREASRASFLSAALREDGARTWVVLWIVVGLSSIALGVYLALR